ncbi:hypothetical protein [Clostridium ljungdahlii]|uniref:Uncharacterized protein n=1 Tax=Clostridium ljungdahlii TaxID=1538 RepID=A0A168MHN5_9CLOT|nr:hypothetical protein [Clostridium ljungdahlii]OAA84704.1 hypothetical protein WY13_02603 [Clostridium ljungdahlii]
MLDLDIKETLKELVNNILENKISRKIAAKLVRERIDESDIFRLQNEDLLVNAYWTINGLDYKYGNTTNSELTYLKLCLDGEREYSREDKAEFVLNNEEPICRLIPSLKGQELDVEEFDKYSPEKMECFNGYAFGDKITCCKLLALLMANVGIETVVKFASKGIWAKALELDDGKSEK